MEKVFGADLDSHRQGVGQNCGRRLATMAGLTRMQLICIAVVVVPIVFHVITSIRQHQQPSSSVSDELIQQRNDVSRKLNSLQERHQQLVCRLVNSSMTSETGGWCDPAVYIVHVTDKALAGALAELFAGRTVVGLGDGRGEYRRLVLGTRLVTRYDAFDGAPNIYNISKRQVKFLDLTLPQYWLPRYDWVLSMEVLEHIEVDYEKIVLDNIDRAAGFGAVLSWASPGQGGFHHVNNRPAEYLRDVMDRRGFRLDVDASRKLRAIATLPWLKRNLMVFYRR